MALTPAGGVPISDTFESNDYFLAEVDGNTRRVSSVASGKGYASFAQFIADTRTFPAGATLTIPSIGAVYQATAGAGNLGQSNAGGQGFNIDAANGVHFEWFGGNPNGAGNEAANNAAIGRFRAWALAQDGLVTLNLRADGDYACTISRWSIGIPELVVNGNGATWRNTGVPGLYVDTTTILTGSGLDKNQGTPGLTYAATDNYRINTTTTGASTFTTTAPADAGNFAVGEWIMLSSHEVYRKNPMAFRNFQYCEITSVDAGTGVVGVKQPVTMIFDADMPDNPSSYRNAARVWKIELGSLWNIDHEYRDMVLVSDNIPNIAAYPILTGKNIRMVRCTSQAFTHSVCDSGALIDCISLSTSEPDKNIKKLLISGGDFAGLSQCTTIDDLTLERTKIHSMPAQVTPNRVKVIDCDIPADWKIYGKRLESIHISGGRLKSIWPFGPSGRTVQRGTDWPGVVVGSGGVTYSNGILGVPMDDTDTRRTVFALCTPGAVLRETTTVSGNIVCTGVEATVVSYKQGAPGVADIGLSVTGTPSPTAIWRFGYIPNLTVENCIFGDTNVPTSFGPKAAHGLELKLQNKLIKAASDVRWVMGVPAKLRVEVKRAATGAGANTSLSIITSDPVFAQIAQVDLDTVGIREISLTGFTGNLDTGDGQFLAKLPTNRSNYTSKLLLNWNGATTLSEHQYAIVDIHMDLTGPVSYESTLA